MSSRQFLESVKYAGRGLVLAYKSEPNMRRHLALALIVIILGALCRLTRLEWAIVLAAITLVVVCELMNTALEYLVDLLKPRLHHQVSAVKDVSAAAVLAASLGALILGIIIFLPHFIGFLK